MTLTLAQRSFKVTWTTASHSSLNSVYHKSPKSLSGLNISETVRDRALLPKDHQRKMPYGESNGHVTWPLTWPMRSHDPENSKSWRQYAQSPIYIEAGAAAEMAATRKEEKYVDLGARYIFESIAVETLGVFNASARHLLDDLGRRISENTDEARQTSFLYQKISILVQRFNAVLLHDSLPATDCTDWWSYPILYLLFNF